MHRLTRLSLAHPKLAVAILAAITIGLGAGLPNVRTEFGYRVLIGEDHPSIQALDALIEQFGGGLPVRIGWRCGEGRPCEHALDESSLQMAHAVTKHLEVSQGIRQVRGPANAPLLTSSQDGFAVRRLIERDGFPSDLDNRVEQAREDPFWRNKIVSSDGTAAMIIVQPTDTRSETDLQVVEALRTALEPFEKEGFEFFIRGDAVELVTNGTSLAESTALLTPFTVLVIIGVLFFSSRAWTHTLGALGAMGVAVLWTVGFMGWLGWPRDAIHEVLLPLILVVGACDAMHLLARYADEQARTGVLETTSTSKLVAAAAAVGPACLMTTLTTVGAFLSFTTSALDAFVRFGVIASFGVVACLALTFSLLPLAVTYLPESGVSARTATRTWKRGIDSLVATTQRRSGPIVGATCLLVVLFSIGWVSHLRVDTDWNESLGEHSRIVQATRFLEYYFGRSQSLELALTLPKGKSIEDPGVLAELASFSESISGIDGLESVTSVLDLLRHVNQILHDSDPDFYKIGATAGANAELLELLSFDDVDTVASWVSLDRSRIRLSVETSEQPYSVGLSILDAVEASARSDLSAEWNVLLSGEVAMNRDWIRDVQKTQFVSFPIAAVIVLVLMSFFLRSFRLACFALVPTLLPVVVTLGAMGWLGMGLDVGRAMIAVVMIGIGVDDAIHLLSQYNERRIDGDEPGAAIAYALQHTGRAIVTTSVSLSLGFLTLMASAWQTISSFGFFVALAIMGALASTLFVLPALIFAFTKGAGRE